MNSAGFSKRYKRLKFSRQSHYKIRKLGIYVSLFIKLTKFISKKLELRLLTTRGSSNICGIFIPYLYLLDRHQTTIAHFTDGILYGTMVPCHIRGIYFPYANECITIIVSAINNMKSNTLSVIVRA